MSYKNIVFAASDDGIATLTINRPQKLNALNSETIPELDQAFSEVASNASIKALILTGAGEKAFVAGADIEGIAASSPMKTAERSEYGQRVFRKLELMNKPSIAAINGYALGGGLELAMCCTLRIASENAKLGQPEVKIGLLPGYGGSQRLPRLVGYGRAMEILLTGDSIDAQEAFRIGLVNKVVPQAELLSECRKLLERILVNGQLAVGLAMRAVDFGLSAGLEEGLKFEATAFGLAAATEDCREGTRAFLEKRKPVFTGK